MLAQPSLLRSRAAFNTLRAIRPARSLNTSAYRLLDTSKLRNDGGPSEIPHHGVNVDKSARMDHHEHRVSDDEFPVVLIGAGNIMFGSDQGPWNHSFRIEHKLGPRLRVVGVIDPDRARVEGVLRKKCESFVKPAYENTVIYSSIDEYYEKLKASGGSPPRAFFVGTPPKFRGGTEPGHNDLELKMIQYFPNVAYFIEKPVSTAPINQVYDVADALKANGNIISVGYMLRYLRAVQKMKQIIHDNGLTVMATNARYSAAYPSIAKAAWWNKAFDQGPVIEQGTHFCDLSRYFGGDVVLDSVKAHSVEWYEKPGALSRIPVDESLVPEDLRIPRISAAVWKYDNGAVGSFMHTVAVHGTAYDCELEVWADGYHMHLVDPYNAPALVIRRPGDDHEERHAFTDDDPFFSEISNFIDAVEGVPDAHILSSYEDAAKTYALTWEIRTRTEAAGHFGRGGR